MSEPFGLSSLLSVDPLLSILKVHELRPDLAAPESVKNQPDQLLFRDGPDVPAVAGIVHIVAQHEVVSGGYRHGFEIAVDILRPKVGPVPLSVDESGPVVKFDGIPWKAGDPLN